MQLSGKNYLCNQPRNLSNGCHGSVHESVHESALLLFSRRICTTVYVKIETTSWQNASTAALRPPAASYGHSYRQSAFLSSFYLNSSLERSGSIARIEKEARILCRLGSHFVAFQRNSGCSVAGNRLCLSLIAASQSYGSGLESSL